MVENLRYDVLSSERRFELRRYPLSVLATVEGLADDDAFRILFGYISGDNSKMEKVSMTVPVVSRDPSSERIAMTVPVVSGGSRFSFVLPAKYPPSEVPEPTDGRVRIEVVPGRELAVVRFRGRAGERSVAARTEELLSSVEASGLVPVGEPFLMRYNPPFIPGFLRRNEVAVEVRTGGKVG